MKAILSAGTRTLPPFCVLSARIALPPGAASAAARSRSTSSAVASVSTTSSRGMDWMPILTSMVPLSVLWAPLWSGLVLALVGSAGPAADAAPGQPRDQLLGRVLRDRAERAQPVPRADLGHADHADRQQVRLVVRQAGVLLDHLADQVGARPVRRVKLGADGRLVGEVRLEDELEGSAVLGHVPEVSSEGRVDPLPVVARRPDRIGDGLNEFVHAFVKQCQIEVLLARKVLVEDRLADAGAFRDLVHRRRMVTACDENLHGRVQ